MIELSNTQLSYLAGLIDGEGSIECQRQRRKHGKTPYYCCRLSFVMATSEPIITIANWLGTVVRVYPTVDKNRSPRWRTEVPKTLLIPLLKHLRDYLILKKDQANLAIRIEETRKEYFIPRTTKGPRSNTSVPAEAIEKMDKMWFELRALKSNKRPISKRRLDFRHHWKQFNWTD